MARSIESISHKFDTLAEAVLPNRRAHYYRSVAQVITPDGRLRADKLDGFVPPDKVPTIGLEYIGDAVVDLDFPSIAAQSYQELTVDVDGARANDGIVLGGPNNQQPNLFPYAYVSANDTVTIRLHNLGTGSSDPSARKWRIWVVR